MSVQLVYATFPDRDSVDRIGRLLLEERLAACFTCWEAGSVYRWEDEIVEDEETLVLFKTVPDDREDLVGFLEDEHPYDVPCVLPIDTDNPLAAYADWVGQETA